MQLFLTEEQQMLAGAAAGFISSRSPLSRVRKLRDSADPIGYSPEIWREMARNGWIGANIPEMYGGSGLGFFELCIVLEAAGRKLMPEPMISTILLGAQTLLLGGSESQKKAWLPKIGAGEAIVPVAYLESGSRYDIGRIATTAKVTPDGFTIKGEKIQVLDGHVADALIVSARSARGKGLDGISLFLVDPKSKGVTIERQSRIDSRNAAIVRLKNVKLDPSALIGNAGEGGEILQQVIDRAAIGLSAEMLGAMQQTFEDTLEYLKTRKQFGAPIGTFQALQHRASRMFVKIALARSTVMAAASAVDADPTQVPHMASLAKASCSDTFLHVANEAIQMHGGVGMTDEFDIGFYLKRARAAEVTFGDAAYHRERWATLSGY